MRLPIAASIETRDGTLSKDAKLVNCFVDMQGESAFVVKRPGLLKTVATASGAGLGMVSWEGNMYNGVGATIYQTSYSSIPSGAGGSGLGTATLDSTVDVWGGDTRYALIVEGSSLYAVYDDGGGTMVAKSTTNGTSWSATINGTGVARNALCAIGSNWYATSGGSCEKSTNHGVSWTTQTASSLGAQVLAGGLISSGSDLYAIGFTGSTVKLVTSANDGVTWTTVGSFTTSSASTTSHLVKIGSSFYSSKMESSTLAAALMKSTDSGVNWTSSTLSATTGSAISKTAIMSDGTNLYMSVLRSSGVLDLYSVDGSAATATLVSSYTVPGTDTYLNINAYFDGKYRFLTYDSDSNLQLNEWSLGSDPWTVPEHSYSATTTTPGLPLSWVGTSPGASTKRLFIKNTEKAWTLTLGTPGTLTQVTDVDYPAVTVPGAAYLDGYFFVMDRDGTIYNCDLENPTSWNALNYITAEAEWDVGVAIAKHQNYVLALKDWTCELFYDAANPTGSPLAKVSNAAIQLGCAQGYSVVQFHGGLAFMSKTREKGRSIHVFPVNGIEPQEIATPAIQRILNAADLTTVSAWGGKIAGRVLYVLNLVTANITLVYDFSTQTWTQWTSDTTGTEGHFLCGFYATDGKRDYLLHESTGDVFSLTMDAYQDNGADIKVLARTGRIDAGNLDRKTMRALSVVGDQAATSVTVQVSDDDYQTFSAARTVSLASLPARLTRLGMFRRRSFDIRHVDNTPLRLLALDAEIEQAR